jgi:NTP pyrophosphatase (non-canonical NTP hydrolase)
MDMDEYQHEALKTAVYPHCGKNLTYPTLGLASEAGEVAGKVKKLHRDHGGVVTPGLRDDIILEVGDTLWYIAALCYELGTTLEHVAAANIEKLTSRQDRDTIAGDGDDR